MVYWHHKVIFVIIKSSRLITFAKSKEYLSNIKALNGLSDVSAGGGILATIALRISIIPTPSYTEM